LCVGQNEAKNASIFNGGGPALRLPNGRQVFAMTSDRKIAANGEVVFTPRFRKTKPKSSTISQQNAA
jgi:hypothetical protein